MAGLNMSQLMQAYMGVEEATKIHRKRKAAEKRATKSKAEKGQEYLDGNVFCFTGKMERRRAEIQSELSDLGGESVYVWRSDVTVLVKVDEDWHSTKVDRAKDLHVPIITEKEYNELIRCVKAGTRPGE